MSEQVVVEASGAGYSCGESRVQASAVEQEGRSRSFLCCGLEQVVRG